MKGKAFLKQILMAVIVLTMWGIGYLQGKHAADRWWNTHPPVLDPKCTELARSTESVCIERLNSLEQDEEKRYSAMIHELVSQLAKCNEDFAKLLERGMGK
jgi:hypothetical protein